MKLTRYDGRAGRNGVYNPKHNDRRFDLKNSDHIDQMELCRNVYWDCYQGLRDGAFEDSYESFERIELRFYDEHYGESVANQNKRNEKTRHTERNRTVEGVLRNAKTCPEETIYQIGDMEQAVSGALLAEFDQEFIDGLNERYGEYYHTIDWALHMEEATPHIHERHPSDA